MNQERDCQDQQVQSGEARTEEDKSCDRVSSCGYGGQKDQYDIHRLHPGHGLDDRQLRKGGPCHQPHSWPEKQHHYLIFIQAVKICQPCTSYVT